MIADGPMTSPNGEDHEAVLPCRTNRVLIKALRGTVWDDEGTLWAVPDGSPKGAGVNVAASARGFFCVGMTSFDVAQEATGRTLTCSVNQRVCAGLRLAYRDFWKRPPMRQPCWERN